LKSIVWVATFKNKGLLLKFYVLVKADVVLVKADVC